MKNSSEKKPNILVQYKGGGYDGCFWEWNFCLVDDESNPTMFQDIFHSGRKGIADLESFKNHRGNYFCMDVSTQEGWEDFDREANPAHVVAVLEWIITNREDLYHPMKCDKCGCEIVIDPCLGGYHGTGGVVIAPSSKTCESCDIRDAWESWVRGLMVEELEKQDYEFPTKLSDEDIDKVLQLAIDCSEAEWEGEGDNRRLYRLDSAVTYVIETPSILKDALGQDQQILLPV